MDEGELYGTNEEGDAVDKDDEPLAFVEQYYKAIGIRTSV